MSRILLVLLLVCNVVLAKPINLANIRITPLPGTVALTFDDGPSPIYTPKVLNILKDNHIKATFFVMGTSAKKYPELIKAIEAAGHSVQIHSMTHPKLTRVGLKKLYYEVVQAKKNVTEILGHPPVCLRPPFGLSNQRLVDFSKQHGIIVVPMGFNSFDYKRPGVSKLTSWVVKNARDGRVFLLHDGYKARQQTVAALPGIIKGIRAKGLGFSSVCVVSR